MRKALFAIVLVAASFAGGAAVNGPGLRMAQAWLMGRLGLAQDTDNLGPTVGPHGDPIPDDSHPGSIPPLAVTPPPGDAGKTKENEKERGKEKGKDDAKPGATAAGPIAPEPSVGGSSQGTKAAGVSAATPAAPAAPEPLEPLVPFAATEGAGADQPAPLPLPLAEHHDPEPSSPAGDRAKTPSKTDKTPDPPVADATPPPTSTPAPTPTRTPKSVRGGTDGNVALASLARADRSEPGAAPTPAGDMPADLADWAAIRRALRALGVSRYGIEGDPNGRVRFHCVIPLAGRRAVGQHFEAEADDELQAARATLRRIALWQASEGNTP